MILRNRHVLAVHDVRAAAQFYADVLGFQIVQEPPGWIFVEREGCMLMLGECPDDLHPARLGCHRYFAYLLVDDADGWHAQIAAKDPSCLGAIEDKPWSMREFVVASTDGHTLTIGQRIASV
jgi:catechol 2,3-dioxygenase-like lactoylglutathione lyase family enzyme